MSASEKQMSANKLNAVLGGVKTPEGKETSRMNAIKHGVLSRLQTDYDLLSIEEAYESFAEEFSATTFSRQILIQQIAITYVRLLRCTRFESEKIREALNPPEYNNEAAFDFGFLDQTVLVAENDKARLEASVMADLEPLYLRYEPQLFKRMLRLLDRLSIPS
jgi:hypothetical protein